MIEKENIIIESIKSDDSYNNFEEALKSTAKVLLNNNLVKDNFVHEILKREENFPTGLNFGSYGIAIPHTDAEFVNKEAMAINVLSNPVKFKQMASDGEVVDVNLIVMLAIKNKDNQVPYLQALISIFQDEEKVRQLLSCDNEELIKEKFKNYIKEIN